uniref:uncharacterized protein LOC122582857 isoform X1 n=1 Tax=Erigeron canadensis TaxID=72917 RepID=UPI001CB8D6C1|nr:uncharacterized protein LOC122582857 isoform X1 [Erigeron canadensis]
MYLSLFFCCLFVYLGMAALMENASLYQRQLQVAIESGFLSYISTAYKPRHDDPPNGFKFEINDESSPTEGNARASFNRLCPTWKAFCNIRETGESQPKLIILLFPF